MAVPQIKPDAAALAASSEKADENKHIFKLDNEPTDLGRADTFRYNVLTWVLAERYDRAIQELKDFLERPSEYPEFHQKVNRYINHGIDLCYAIKAKRNFPGINSLTRAKQQELREKFKEHFRELQYVLTRVEKVERDLRISDARSTIYVVRAIWVASVAVICLAFFLEAVRGLGTGTWLLYEETMMDFTEWLFSLVGW